jgi:hypothetical protein
VSALLVPAGGPHGKSPDPLVVHIRGGLHMVNASAGAMIRVARVIRGARPIHGAPVALRGGAPTDQPKSVRPHQSWPSRSPGGQANTADEVCRMYSFIASVRRFRCTWTNPVSGFRW